MPITNILKVSDYINTENNPYKMFSTACFAFKIGSTCLKSLIVEISNFVLKDKTTSNT